jgi:large subunit ribosomal protein L6
MQSLSKPRCSTCGSLILKRRSHIGRAVIQVPTEVSLDLAPLPRTSNTYVANPFLRDASVLSVKGPKGALQVTLPKFVSLQPPVQQKPTSFAVSVRDPKAKPQRAMWGLTRSLIHNAIQGVHAGHEASINMVGVGYRAALENGQDGRSQLSMKLGYPNPVVEVIPAGIQAEVTSPTSILLRGADKQAIGQFAATIRRHRPPEPYNGKVRLCFGL